MSMKRFTISFLCAALALLLLVAGTVLLIDPLYQYHLPYMGLPMPLFLDRYQGPGLAKNYDYDAVIVGSSMVRNCRASWFSDAFSCRALKLPLSAGYMTDFDALLTTVFSAGSPRYVFFNLDLYALSEKPGYQQSELPMYLYDTDKSNDVQYLFNKDVLLDVFPQYIEGCQTPEPFEDAFSFIDEYPFGKAAALRTYGHTAPAEKGAQQGADALLAPAAENLACLTKHILAHPETEFVVFVPPYSLLYWDSYIRQGQHDAMHGALAYAAETLLGYGNVRVFSFLDMEEVVTNLDNYMDNMHFTREINELVVEKMAAGEYELTRENDRERLAATKDFTWNYDYARLFE